MKTCLGERYPNITTSGLRIIDRKTWTTHLPTKWLSLFMLFYYRLGSLPRITHPKKRKPILGSFLVGKLEKSSWSLWLKTCFWFCFRNGTKTFSKVTKNHLAFIEWCFKWYHLGWKCGGTIGRRKLLLLSSKCCFGCDLCDTRNAESGDNAFEEKLHRPSFRVIPK